MGKQATGPDTNNNVSNSSKSSGPASPFLLFARNFLKHPNLVGWMLPSSSFVVDKVLNQIDATLIALEINSEFLEFLRGSIRDPRLRLVQESAAEIDSVLACLGYAHADHVISGIPFKTLPHPLRETIVRKTHSVLRPKGSFLVYQLSSVVLPYLEQVFGPVRRDIELLNFVPGRLFYCSR
jgi:phospholipid N-methyltransferase